MNRKVESEKDWGKENVRWHEKRDFFLKKSKKESSIPPFDRKRLFIRE